jgi:hypothetical protein
MNASAVWLGGSSHCTSSITISSGAASAAAATNS